MTYQCGIQSPGFVGNKGDFNGVHRCHQHGVLPLALWHWRVVAAQHLESVAVELH